jgi:hypothetical protein
MLLFKKIPQLFLLCVTLSTSIIACAPRPTPGPDAQALKTAQFEQALLTATYAVPSPTLTPAPTNTQTPIPSPTATVTPIRTPPALSAQFKTDLLNAKDVPQSYIQGTCDYLRAKWDPNNAAPGTVVMPIMFHSITDGDINHLYQITAEAVTQLLRDLKKQGFEAITMQQLANFLQHNAKIPARSVLLIVDDLHTESYYRDHFVPILKEYGWHMTNAWISSPEDSKRVRDGNVKLQQEGWVEHQAHGVVHNINITEFSPNTFINTPLYGNITAEQFTKNEIEGSMKAINETFGKAPIAYIWPGGNFSTLGVKDARTAGYQLGFTVNPRGPLMYNWIPQGAEADPGRPSFLPEGYIKDPLMTLPRFWDIDARYHLDTIRQIGKQAAEYAQTNKANELTYYEIVCQPQTGPIPTVSP